MIGIVKGNRIGKNRDGDKNVVLLSVEISAGDIQTCEWIQQGGEFYIPENESRVQIANNGESWKIAYACDDGVECDIEAGEKKLYAGGSKIYLRKDGVVIIETASGLEINSAGDYAILYNELKTVYDKMIVDMNVEFAKIATVLPAYQPLIAPIVSDISPAKDGDVKL